HPPGAYFDLLDFDSHTPDLRMIEHEGRDALGQCLEQWNMTPSCNQADAIDNNVIRENVAHILRRLGGAGDLGTHVETQALRMRPFTFICSDPHGDLKVLHQDPIDRTFVVGFAGITARRQYPIVAPLLFRALSFAWVLRYQSADQF